MIVDAETLDLSNSIEALLSGIPQDLRGEVKPELLESVCEIATRPCENTQEAGQQLRELRRATQATAAAEGLAIGSAGTHPFAMWGDARVVARPRYRGLIAGLQVIARPELIFGQHLHVAGGRPDKGVHVAHRVPAQLP